MSDPSLMRSLPHVMTNSELVVGISRPVKCYGCFKARREVTNERLNHWVRRGWTLRSGRMIFAWGSAQACRLQVNDPPEDCAVWHLQQTVNDSHVEQEMAFNVSQGREMPKPFRPVSHLSLLARAC